METFSVIGAGLRGSNPVNGRQVPSVDIRGPGMILALPDPDLIVRHPYSHTL